MLHILLTLLKIIGILILSVIGICIFLVLTVIFTPLRYELNGDCKGDIDSLNINARLSFFIHLIVVRIHYHNKKLEWQARLAWKHLDNQENDSRSDSSNKDNEDLLSEPKPSAASSESSEVSVSKAKNNILLNKAPETKTTVKTTTSEKESLNNGDTKKVASKTDGSKPDTSSTKTIKKETVQAEEKSEDKPGLSDKINSIINKIKCTSTKIYDMINLIKGKTELITDFFNNESHKAGFEKLLSELKKLFKKLPPKKLRGTILFGFEDPGLTGKVLAVVSLFYPYIKEHLNIYTDFEEKKLIGNLYIKGKIRISTFLSFLLNLVLNKNVRITISHISELVKKLKQGGK